MSPQNSEQARWFVDEVLPNEANLRSWLRARFPAIEDKRSGIGKTLHDAVKNRDQGIIIKTIVDPDITDITYAL